MSDTNKLEKLIIKSMEEQPDDWDTLVEEEGEEIPLWIVNHEKDLKIHMNTRFNITAIDYTMHFGDFEGVTVFEKCSKNREAFLTVKMKNALDRQGTAIKAACKRLS